MPGQHSLLQGDKKRVIPKHGDGSCAILWTETSTPFRSSTVFLAVIRASETTLVNIVGFQSLCMRLVCGSEVFAYRKSVSIVLGSRVE